MILIAAFACLAAAAPRQEAHPDATAPPPEAPPALRRQVDQVFPEVARLRGLDFRWTVPVGLQTAEGFMEYMERSLAESPGSMDLDDFQDVAELEGLVAPGADILEQLSGVLHSSVGGYYDFRFTKSFYMIDTFRGGAMGEVIMAHEICHALEDQHFELKSLLGSSPDSDHAAALGAVIEGSATVLMNAYALQVLPGRLKGMSPEERQALGDDTGAMVQAMQDLADAPPLLVAMVQSPYITGSKFISRSPLGLGKPAAADWNRVWTDPPRSTEQILHPGKYWDPGLRDEPVPVEVPDLSAALGAGWSLGLEDVNGELGFSFMFADDLPSDPIALQGLSWATPGTTGWGGDRLHLYRGPDGARILLLATVWDRAEDREEFLDELVDLHVPRNPFFRGVHAGLGKSAERTALLLFADEAGANRVRALQEAFLAAKPGWR